jgi:hypothetical protein
VYIYRELTVREYDLEQFKQLRNQQMIGAIIMGIIYYNWRSLMPLVCYVIHTHTHTHTHTLTHTHARARAHTHAHYHWRSLVQLGGSATKFS